MRFLPKALFITAIYFLSLVVAYKGFKMVNDLITKYEVTNELND